MQCEVSILSIADWNRKDGVMKDDLFEKIATEICEHSAVVRRVHLYRDGEPLLDKRLPGRIARLKRGGIREVGISTNGELLSPLKAGQLFAAGLDELILSIDSMERNTYEKLRVGLDYETVIANAKECFFIRNNVNSKCRIRVRMIRQEANREEWDSGRFADVWRSRLSDGDTVEAKDIHNWGSQLEGFKPVGKADVELPCVALWSLCVIFADGTVPLCNVDFNGKHKLGNVKDSSISEIWRSAEQNRRREAHFGGRRGVAAPICKGCTVWAEGGKHVIQPAMGH